MSLSVKKQFEIPTGDYNVGMGKKSKCRTRHIFRNACLVDILSVFSLILVIE